LKRRYDLIPNLVESARSFMQHERETLERVIAARNQATSSLDAAAQPGGGGKAAVQQWLGAENALGSALGRMSFVMEDYPELKADKNIAALMEELKSTENRVAFARQAYNDWCTTFNVARQSFPNVVFAGMFGYEEDRLLLEFQDEEAIQDAPQVNLSPANS
ncbi:MAG: LemA family protein, partial [Planctomycetota bacterium]